MSILPDPRTRGRKSDRKFFTRRPDRRHRFRPAFRGEAEAFGAAPPNGGQRYFMAIQLHPGHGLIAIPIALPFAPDVADRFGEVESEAVFEAAIGSLSNVATFHVEAPMPMEAGE